MSPSAEKPDNEPTATVEQAHSLNERSVGSGSTITPSAGKEKPGSRPSSSQKNTPVAVDDDALFAHLPESEKAVLKKQLHAEESSVSFIALFRYASRMDMLIIFVSAICAIAAGAALPLFTVSALGHQLQSLESLPLTLPSRSYSAPWPTTCVASCSERSSTPCTITN